MAAAEECMGSGAQCTPLNGYMELGCIFCNRSFRATHVLLVGAEQTIPIEQVKPGDRVLIGIMPVHPEE